MFSYSGRDLVTEGAARACHNLVSRRAGHRCICLVTKTVQRIDCVDHFGRTPLMEACRDPRMAQDHFDAEEP